MLSDGHVLLEDVPGTGKTSLARAMAQTVQGTNTRIQFTPDLLPGDITGVTRLRPEERARSSSTRAPSSRTSSSPTRSTGPAQDAVRPARGHGGGERHHRRRHPAGRRAVPRDRDPEPHRAGGHLPSPRGAARPVPHAHVLGYPDHAATRAHPRRRGRGDAPSSRRIITPQALVGMADLAREVYVDALVLDYVARLVDATRSADEVRLGREHPRRPGAHARRRTRAASQGRTYATPDDVSRSPSPCSRTGSSSHPEAEFDGVTPGGRHRPGAAGCAAPHSSRGGMSTDSRITRAAVATGAGDARSPTPPRRAPRARLRARRGVVDPGGVPRGSAGGRGRARGGTVTPAGVLVALAATRRSGDRLASAGSSGWWPDAVALLLLLAHSVPVRRARLRRRSVTRPRTRRRGRGVVGEIAIRNNGRRIALPGRLDLPVGEASSSSAFRCCARPHVAQPLDIPALRRGIMTVGPATTVRSDPIGLLRREHAFEDVHQLYVHPRTTAVPSTSAGLIRDLEGNPTRRLVDADMSFHAIREYTPGDSRRQIHWKSTAKTGQLMVRQYEESRRSRMAIVLGRRRRRVRRCRRVRARRQLRGVAGHFAPSATRGTSTSSIGAEIPRVVRGRLRAIRHLPAASPRGAARRVQRRRTLENTMPVEEVCRLDRRVERRRCRSLRRRRLARAARRLQQAALAFPADTTVVAVICDERAHPRMQQLVRTHGADRRHARRPLGPAPAGATA